MGKATDLIIRLLVDDSDLDKVDKSKVMFDAWGDGLGTAATGATVAVAALGTAAAFTAHAASEAEQASGAVEAVFKGQAAAIQAVAADTHDAVTLNSADYMNMAATLGAQLKNMGMAQDEVGGQTQNLIALGSDMSAMFGGTASEAVEAISALLRGERDPIERYGVSIREATVAAEAMSLGLVSTTQDLDKVKAAQNRAEVAQRTYNEAVQKHGENSSEALSAQASLISSNNALEAATAGTTNELTDQQKLQATLSILTRQTADTQGQSAREADTAAGAQARMNESIGTASAIIGAALLPLLAEGAGHLAEFATWAGENVGLVQSLAVAVGVAAVAVIGANAAFKTMMVVQGIGTALGLFKVAQTGATAATTAQTAAQWANNAAWLASPITWIIAAIIVAIGLLVLAVIWLVNNWDSVISWLGDAWNWLYTNAIKPVIDAISTAFQWLFDNAIKPVADFIGSVLNGIGQAFQWLYQNIIAPVITAILIYTGLWAAAIVWLWENVAMPVFDLIGQAFRWLGENVFGPVSNFISDVIRNIAITFEWFGQNVISPVSSFISDVIRNVGLTFDWLYQNVIVPVGQGIQSAINVVGGVFSWLWQNAIMPAVNGIGSGINWVYQNIISPVFKWISDAVTNVGNTFQKIFGAIGGFISNAFNGAISAVKGPLNGLIGLVNSAIRGLNGLSLTIPDWVPQVGGQRFGISLPQIPYLATGGVTMGPMLAVVGDNPGGREYIEPVDRVASRMERVAIDSAAAARAGQSGGGMTRLAREDMELVAKLIGDNIYPLIVAGAQRQIRTALGG